MKKLTATSSLPTSSVEKDGHKKDKRGYKVAPKVAVPWRLEQGLTPNFIY